MFILSSLRYASKSCQRMETVIPRSLSSQMVELGQANVQENSYLKMELVVHIWTQKILWK